MTTTTTNRRTAPSATAQPDADMIDIGRAVLPKRTTMFIASTDADAAFTGSLCGAWNREGEPYAVMVHDGQRVRHVYVERVARWIEPEVTPEEVGA